MKPSIRLLLNQTRCLQQRVKPQSDIFGTGKQTSHDDVSFGRTFTKIMNQIIDSKETKSTRTIIDESKDLFNQLNTKTSNKIVYKVNPINDKLKKLNTSTSIGYDFNREYLNMEKKSKLINSLKPTLNQIKQFKTDYEIMEFTQSLIVRFNKEKSKKSIKLNDELLSLISSTSLNTPLIPILNQFTLPMIIETAIIEISSKFKSPQESLTLFEMIKNLNMRTFIYCISIEIYNEILKVYWYDYKDISSVYNLIEELKFNAIQGNIQTVQILNKISMEAHKLLNNEDDNSIDFELFDLEKGIINKKYENASAYNRKDEDELSKIDQFIHDLNSSIVL